MTRTVSIEAEVDIDLPEVLERASTEQLIEALRNREDGRRAVPDEPLTQIWTGVMRHGRRLEDVVDDLMRERTWPWRRQGER